MGQKTLRQIYNELLEGNPEALDIPLVVDLDGEGVGWDVIGWEVSDELVGPQVLALSSDGKTTDFEYID